MKLRIFLFLISLILFSCKEKTSSQIITIATDNFPELKIDLIKADTSKLEKLLTSKIQESNSNSVKIVIECNDNAVLSNIQATTILVNRSLNVYKGHLKIYIYNKCLEELKLETKQSNYSKYIVVNVNDEGKLVVNKTIITVDAFCKEHKGKNIKILLTGKKNLPIDKIFPVSDRFAKEKFLVVIKVE